MTKTLLLWFWIIWLLDVLLGLLGYREFIHGVFGRYAAANAKYITLWIFIFSGLLIVLYSSLYFKNQEKGSMALIIAAIPVLLLLPYLLFIGAVMLGGRGNWQ